MQDTTGDKQLAPRQAAEAVAHWAIASDFSGWDPYDALNSPIIRTFSLGLKWPRIAATQALKRSPVNLRAPLLVRKGHNPKGLGLYLSSFLKLADNRQEPSYQRAIARLTDLVKSSSTATTNGRGWGYNFDWQSRAFYVPKGTPTIVNTSFVGNALLDLHDREPTQAIADLIVSAREFILKDLNRSRGHDSFCFSYTPIDHLKVHNANLLGAAFLARSSTVCPSREAEQAAAAAAHFSVQSQRTDGSWFYADTNYQDWIDSFHTGFNLDSLRTLVHLGFGSEFERALHDGTQFYVQNFFGDSGECKYYHNNLEPEDIHCPAMALVYLPKLGSEYTQLCSKVASYMISRFWTKRGFFAARRWRGRPISIPYVRWAQGWALHGLTSYLAQNGSESSPQDFAATGSNPGRA